MKREHLGVWNVSQGVYTLLDFQNTRQENEYTAGISSGSRDMLYDASNKLWACQVEKSCGRGLRLTSGSIFSAREIACKVAMQLSSTAESANSDNIASLSFWDSPFAGFPPGR